MNPLKITAYLQTGQVATMDGFLPLDSILAAAFIRKFHTAEFYRPKKPGEFGGIIADLPFEKRGLGDDWYWACSFNRGIKLGEYVAYWHKRFDDHLEQYLEFGKRRGKINIKSSKYKNYRMPLVIMLFDKLVWYAVGDQDAVYELCCGVTHIGKKTAQGYGAVSDWQVKKIKNDYSERGPDGEIMRAIPGIKEGRISMHGIRSPYWLNDNKRVCTVPEVRDRNGSDCKTLVNAQGRTK